VDKLQITHRFKFFPVEWDLPGLILRQGAKQMEIYLIDASHCPNGVKGIVNVIAGKAITDNAKTSCKVDFIAGNNRVTSSHH